MRDLIVSLTIFGLMPLCFRRPFVGLAVFSWLAYMRVQDLAWGFARYQRWSYYIAILMFSGFLVARGKKRYWIPDLKCWIMLVLVALLGIGIALSDSPDKRQFGRYLEFVKIVGIAIFTTAVVTNKERLRVLIWVIALSLGFYGVKSGIWGILTLGQSRIISGPGGMLADNNDLALALAMACPMLFHLGWTERRPSIKRAFWVVLPLTIITVGLTQSRGGFLAVCVGTGVMVWRSRNRMIGLFIGFLAAIAAFLLAPEAYKERLKTITEYKTEGSAAGRLRAWGIATRMAADHPFLGVGFGKFRQHYLDYCLDPTPSEIDGTAVIVAHSSYFQVLAECGVPALVLYVTLIFLSMVTVWQIRKEARQRYFTSWIINYATMFEASLATFIVGASFLNRAHFDLFYHWVALIVCFGVIARQEMRQEAVYPVRMGTRGPIRNVRSPGFEPRPRVAQVGGFRT